MLLYEIRANEYSFNIACDWETKFLLCGEIVFPGGTIPIILQSISGSMDPITSNWSYD